MQKDKVDQQKLLAIINQTVQICGLGHCAFLESTKDVLFSAVTVTLHNTLQILRKRGKKDILVT